MNSARRVRRSFNRSHEWSIARRAERDLHQRTRREKIQDRLVAFMLAGGTVIMLMLLREAQV